MRVFAGGCCWLRGALAYVDPIIKLFLIGFTYRLITVAVLLRFKLNWIVFYVPSHSVKSVHRCITTVTRVRALAAHLELSTESPISANVQISSAVQHPPCPRLELRYCVRQKQHLRWLLPASRSSHRRRCGTRS